MAKIQSLKQFVSSVKKGQTSIVEHTQKILEEAEKANKKFNHFNLIAKDLALKQAKEAEAGIKTGRNKGKLLGVPISVKDCICVKGIESRAGSKMLSGYEPVFNATVIEKARKEGAIIIGKTAQDESFQFRKTRSIPKGPAAALQEGPRALPPFQSTPTQALASQQAAQLPAPHLSAALWA